jgi:hypothetical protein
MTGENLIGAYLLNKITSAQRFGKGLKVRK